MNKITGRLRFIQGECKAIGFTDGKIYDAWKRPGYEDRPLRTWHVVNDNGHERVVLPFPSNNAHCKPSQFNGLLTGAYCQFEEVTDEGGEPNALPTV